MASCEMSFIRYLLFIFNLIFAISGIGIIIAGALVLADISDFDHFMDSGLIAPPIVLIAVGAVVFLIASMGCFGAIRENYTILIAFAICLLIIFILELAVGIAAAVYRNDFGEALKATLKKSVESYGEKEMERISWDKAQRELMCCGVDGPGDWINAQQTVPFSCCNLNEEYAQKTVNLYCINAGKGKYMYQLGCYGRLTMKINQNSKVLIGVGIGIAFVEIVGIILACWLANAIKNGGKSDDDGGEDQAEEEDGK